MAKQHPAHSPTQEHVGALSRLHITAETKQYLRFGGMVASSTIVMFCLTYTNVYSAGHIRWSEERAYMALLMGSAMAVIMLGFMTGMLKNRLANAGIVIGAVVVGSLSLWLSRSQYYVDDTDYMSGMIPHHSIAILTSERADIQDVRVRRLADGISATQKREIAEMEWLIDDIEKNGLAKTDAEASGRQPPQAENP